MIGIYKFTNKINKKCYIGQSVDIYRRFLSHKNSSFNKKTKDYNSQFHQAIRKYGWDNFDFEILIKDVRKEDLNKLEQYYIKLYDSYKNGYNATIGGSSQTSDSSGEKNGRSLLNTQDVIYIRECYNNHIPFRQVYEEYKTKISKRGLQKVWSFETWKNIKPEYNTLENKYFHSHQAKANSSEIAAQNKRKFSDEDVRKMREEYENGVSIAQIWKKYGPNMSKSTIYNIVKRITYRDIQ